MSVQGLIGFSGPMTTIPSCLLDRMATFRKTISDTRPLAALSCVNGAFDSEARLFHRCQSRRTARLALGVPKYWNWSSTSVKCCRAR